MRCRKLKRRYWFRLCGKLYGRSRKAGLAPNTGVDSDSDGLTDVEEKDIYKTDPYNFDTDADTFNDGNEVSHLYDPNKKRRLCLRMPNLTRSL